jgi:hypothetical protein
MKYIGSVGAACLAIVASTGVAAALEYRPLSNDGEMPIVVVSGDFEAGEQLDGFMAAVTQIGAKAVTFNSPGGSVGTAIRLGRIIRAAGLGTIQVRQLECASACSLAFVGGVQRVADPGSIGVHRSSFAPDAGMTADDAVARIQAGTAEIISYLNEMGVDPKLLAIALSYDKSDMRYLSSSEMADLRVTSGATGDVSWTPPTPTPQAYPGPTARADDHQLENAAVAFIKGLIEEHGDNTALAISQVLSSYASTVDYYGKYKSLSEIVEDKRKYYLRWPERGYRVRDDTVMVTCANDRCMVSGVYDWVVRSLSRHKQRQGVARFSYTIAVGSDPRIIAEAGEVIR